MKPHPSKPEKEKGMEARARKAVEKTLSGFLYSGQMYGAIVDGYARFAKAEIKKAERAAIMAAANTLCVGDSHCAAQQKAVLALLNLTPKGRKA